jgi:hypothetical protein
MRVRIELDEATVRACLQGARVAYWADVRPAENDPATYLISEREGLEDDAPAKWCTWPIPDAELRTGLEAMAKGSPKAFSAFLSGRADADTGDVLLQYIVLGSVVYG